MSGRQCDLCSELEKGDTLYKSGDWDGGMGFEYIHNIQYCPLCGKQLTTYKERLAKKKHEDTDPCDICVRDCDACRMCGVTLENEGECE